MRKFINHICHHCNKEFLVEKSNDTSSKNSKNRFCSIKCFNQSKKNRITMNCTNCNKEIEKTPSQIKKSKSGNSFCCKSCAGSYNNKNKKHGTRRSKLENWLEEQLIKKYPNLEFQFNHKDIIKSELDIYIPSLKLAFELNGIFHYEPIFGDDKLQKIQENDINKFQSCYLHSISLCIIDTSGQKYFKESTSKKYLDIIVNIITNSMSLTS